MILRSVTFFSIVIYMPQVIKIGVFPLVWAVQIAQLLCCEPHISNVALISKSYNDHYLFLMEDNTFDLQILFQSLHVTYKITERFESSEIISPSLQECISKMFPWVGVVILYLYKLLFEESDSVWKGKAASCNRNTKEKRQVYAFIMISLFSITLWSLTGEWFTTVWQSLPRKSGQK